VTEGKSPANSANLESRIMQHAGSTTLSATDRIRRDLVAVRRSIATCREMMQTSLNPDMWRETLVRCLAEERELEAAL
jgi:hypothetical protein